MKRYWFSRTISGNLVFPVWWVALFGGKYLQVNAGYGWMPSLYRWIKKYYKETWGEKYTLKQWITNRFITLFKGGL